MKYKLHNSKYNDYFIIEGNTIKECKNIVYGEMAKRNWKPSDCWSKQIE